MSKTKHTQGKMTREGTKRQLFCVNDEVVMISVYNSERSDANGKQIMLAWNCHDDLLAALKAMVDSPLHDPNIAIQQAIDAIAKVEKETQ